MSSDSKIPSSTQESTPMPAFVLAPFTVLTSQAGRCVARALSAQVSRACYGHTALSRSVLRTANAVGCTRSRSFVAGPARSSFFGKASGTFVTSSAAPLSRRNSVVLAQAPISSPAVEDTVTEKGQVVHGFEKVREEFIPELNTKAEIYRHVKTGAELLSLLNDDENKVFGACFRTPPSDSTGVPHILEHSVLCGSRKYPSKEPFVELLKGSLQTFLNAFTFPDKTCYPVASCNHQDFKNLIDVYLDAVFHPRLTPATLAQEGWHYEIEKPDEPLTYKGVVFNEMKGVYSSPDSVMNSVAFRSLFPDITYGVDSGGDPRSTSITNIPDLTFEEFKGFHDMFYHPSNARLFFYGDFDPTARLAILDEYLSDFDPIQPQSAVPLQPKWSTPKSLERSYNASEAGGKKAMLSVNWLLPETTDPKLVLSLDILSHILLATSASPLRKALIDSGLGEDVIGGGLDSDLRQMVFSAGLKGISAESGKDVEELLFSSLTKLAEEGIDKDTVEASMNTIEFQLRENNTGTFPRGLSLMIRSLTTWLYDADPLAPLRFEEPLAYVKSKLAEGDGRYFESLIKEHLLENKHRSTVLLKPDPAVGIIEDEAEKARLAEAKELMGAEGVEEAIKITKALKLRQEAPDSPEDLAKIPMLGRADLEPKIRTVPTTVSNLHGATVLHHPLFTQDIVYFDLGLDLSKVPIDLVPYIPLFSKALLQMGTSELNFVELSQRIGQKTGGIRLQTLTSAGSQGTPAQGWLIVRGKAMRSQTEDMVSILRDVLTDVKLDDLNRFKQLVLEQKAGLESRLVPGGHMLVAQRLSSLFGVADWASEQMGGVSYLTFLRNLVEELETNWDGILGKLKQVQAALLNRSAMVLNVTADDATYASFAPVLDSFVSSLPEAPSTKTGLIWAPQFGSGFEGYVIPAQVNYVGKGANLYDLGYKLDGSSLVIQNFISTGYLWDRVRVQGGAYGGFCRFDPRSGVFNFLSYRDPNLLATLDNYDGAAAFLSSVDVTDSALTQAIIGTIGDLDAYQLPDAKGFTAMMRYLLGDTDDYRQRIRDEVLATSVQKFREFADVLGEVKSKGKVVVVGSQDAISSANAANGDFLSVIKL